MDNSRFVIDVRDQFGWVSYSFHDDLQEAKKEARALAESFSEVVLIDRENASVVDEECRK